MRNLQALIASVRQALEFSQAIKINIRASNIQQFHQELNHCRKAKCISLVAGGAHASLIGRFNCGFRRTAYRRFEGCLNFPSRIGTHLAANLGIDKTKSGQNRRVLARVIKPNG